MATNVRLDIDAEAFLRSLKSYVKKFDNAVERAQEKNMEDLERESVALAPFKTGELQSSSKTETQDGTNQTVGSVTFEAEHAAIRHNKLDDSPGPGTAAKSPTQYGTPGPNYIQNPARGLGKDRVYHKNLDTEVKKI